jgi:hypothetical protein
MFQGYLFFIFIFKYLKDLNKVSVQIKNLSWKKVIFKIDDVELQNSWCDILIILYEEII